ncbi:MAG TPA: orotidine-5'-phosphate decarboxylase [Pyrinomonadaceae bacterium]|nr:orotidine-5'-phosphate decarboxylase [Pyrinomonadaceae bacterium]
METDLKNRLIVALDVETARRALDLVAILKDHVGMFKVGSQLFTAAGPDIVREIVKAGNRVFLDLKFHDIPNTVAAAAVEATRMGATIVNVHAAGGGEMMKRTADAVTETATTEGFSRPFVIAVTVLTSSDETTLMATGISNSPENQVIKLGLLAAHSGMDGLVASPLEVAGLRAAISKPDFLLVTPGVRPSGAAPNDQKRTMSPAAAISAGADYLVVGRPISAAKDPLAAAQAILAEIASVGVAVRAAKQELQGG